jgi:hypothetical protein
MPAKLGQHAAIATGYRYRYRAPAVQNPCAGSQWCGTKKTSHVDKGWEHAVCESIACLGERVYTY